jgi:hypothetical protein
MRTVLKVGDKIAYRGCFGSGPVEIVTVEGIEVTEHPREKYGESVTECSLDIVKQNRANLSLDNGCWCYSDQFMYIV